MIIYRYPNGHSVLVIGYDNEKRKALALFISYIKDLNLNT